MTMLTGKGVEYGQLAALKGAVKLEKLGMKHSSGKSMRKAACTLLGLKPRTSYDDVISAIQKRMDEILNEANKE